VRAIHATGAPPSGAIRTALRQIPPGAAVWSGTRPDPTICRPLRCLAERGRPRKIRFGPGSAPNPTIGRLLPESGENCPSRGSGRAVPSDTREQLVSRWRRAVLRCGRDQVGPGEQRRDLAIPGAVTFTHPLVQRCCCGSSLEPFRVDRSGHRQLHQGNAPRVGRVPEREEFDQVRNSDFRRRVVHARSIGPAP